MALIRASVGILEEKQKLFLDFLIKTFFDLNFRARLLQCSNERMLITAKIAVHGRLLEERKIRFFSNFHSLERKSLKSVPNAHPASLRVFLSLAGVFLDAN